MVWPTNFLSICSANSSPGKKLHPISVRTSLIPASTLTNDLSQKAPNVWFITVTVSGPNGRLRKPGDTDPSIPAVLADKFNQLAEPFDHAGEYENPLFLHYWKAVCQLDERIDEMEKGSSERWWDPVREQPDEMAYECDAKLGSPAAVDCTQIQWQGLGPPSDTIQVAPGVNKLFSTSRYLNRHLPLLNSTIHDAVNGADTTL